MKNLVIFIPRTSCILLDSEAISTFHAVESEYRAKIEDFKKDASSPVIVTKAKIFGKSLVSYLETLEKSIKKFIKKFDSYELQLWEAIRTRFYELTSEFDQFLSNIQPVPQP